MDKGQRAAAYRLLKKMIETNSYLEKELKDLPSTIEEHVKRIVTSTFRPEDITNFVVKELFEIYMAANGKKEITKFVKGKPKELLNILKLMNELATKLLELEKAKQPANSGNNNGVVLQFVGLNPPSNSDATIVNMDTNDKLGSSRGTKLSAPLGTLTAKKVDNKDEVLDNVN